MSIDLAKSYVFKRSEARKVLIRHHEDKSKSKEQLLLGLFGGPGTGKGICINSVHHLLQKLAVTLGPTGKVAYINAGSTIHSALCIPPRCGEPNDGLKQQPTKLRSLQEKF